MAFALTEKDLAKALLDKEATGLIEQHMYNPREQERINRGDTIEEALGGPVGDQKTAFLGDLWNKLKDKYKENQNWEPTYPTEPDNLRQRRLEKEYPELRNEPQEFSKTDVNRQVAKVVADAAMGVAEKNPEWVGLDNDYIAGGTNGRMAQDIFNRTDRTENMSNQDMIDLLRRVGIEDVSAWENPPAERTWKDKGYPYPGFEENTQENIRRSIYGYTDDNNDGSTEDEYLDYMQLIQEVREKGDRLGWEK